MFTIISIALENILNKWTHPSFNEKGCHLMNLVKTLLATTLVLSAFSTFAATSKEDKKDHNVIASSQEKPVNTETSAAGQPTTAQPATEVAADESSSSPTTVKPAQ